MEKIQERAMRFALNDYTTEYNDFLAKYGKSTLYLKRVRTMAHEVYKAINNLRGLQSYPQSKSKIFKINFEIQIRFIKKTFGPLYTKSQPSSLWLPQLYFRGAKSME